MGVVSSWTKGEGLASMDTLEVLCPQRLFSLAFKEHSLCANSCSRHQKHSD